MAGSGNGKVARANKVSSSALYRQHQQELEAEYPWLRRERVFAGIEAFMVVCDPAKDAANIGALTWLVETPAHPELGSLAIYFTYAEDQIHLRNVLSEPTQL
jgi:hypothetical protein